MFVDLHLHTLHSDGKLNVKDTIDRAINRKIKLISITDHDTINGVDEAIRYSCSKGITCISGIELSCRNDNQRIAFPQDVSIHLLGYNIDYHSSELQSYLTNYHAKRKRILDELIIELACNNFDVCYEDINVIAGKQMRIQDVINHINSCFMCNERKMLYIDITSKYYFRLFAVDSTLQTAIELIKRAGGIVVLAHAFFSYKDYDVKLNSYSSIIELLDYLCDLGVDGIEAFYPKYTTEQCEFLQKEAEKRNLIVTAGSDFHGTSLRKNMMDKNITQLSKTTELLLQINKYKNKRIY